MLEAEFKRDDYQTAQVVTAAADDVLFTVPIDPGARNVVFWVKNTDAADAFDQFDVQVQNHASADWETIATIAADYATPVLPMRWCYFDDDPVTLNAAGSACLMCFETAGLVGLRVLVSGNGAASEASYAWRME